MTELKEETNPNKIKHRVTNFGLRFIGNNGAYTERIFCQYKP